MVNKLRKRRQNRQQQRIEKEEKNKHEDIDNQSEQSEADSAVKSREQRKQKVNLQRRLRYLSSPSQRRSKSNYYQRNKSPLKERMRQFYSAKRELITEKRKEEYSKDPTLKRMKA